MAKLNATITVKDDESGAALGGVEVEFSNVDKKVTGVDGTAHFDVEEGTGYDLKVRNNALRPTYKDEGDFWLTEVVNSLPDTQRGRYTMLPGEAIVWGIKFSAAESGYEVRMRHQLQHKGTVAAVPEGKATLDQTAQEVVIVVGTNWHDNTYGNKMMFLAQAVGAIRNAYSSEAYLSLLVFPDGYTSGELAEARQRALENNSRTAFVQLGSKQELVNYVNTRSVDASHDYRANERILIKEVRIFSHGVPSRLAFGLDLAKDRAGALEFGPPDVASLKVEAFTAWAVIHSFACRTGNTSWNESFGDDWVGVAKPKESLAQNLADGLGIKVRGYITRSNYGPTYADKPSAFGGTLDADYSAAYVDLADPAVAGGKVIWNHRGAFREPRSGDKPVGLPERAGGLWIFEKGKDPIQTK